MADIERVQSRLGNIRTVEPILGALRTISLGNWQAALKQHRSLQAYAARLQALLPALMPYLSARQRGSARRRAGEAAMGQPGRVLLVVIGSERGLCGRFNAAVVERAQAHRAAQLAAGGAVQLGVLGGRAARLLERAGQAIMWRESVAATALPLFEPALRRTRAWLASYEAGELDAVDLVYNAYRGPGQYAPQVLRLIPPEAPPLAAGVADSALWPPPIVETDPMALYARVLEQWTALTFYATLLDAAAAEHATRFQLMEAATQNAERLIEDLTQELQAIRRQAITREMQELAAGAGLLG